MKQTIVIFTRSLPHHSLGGMEIVTWDLARAFVALGYQVNVITTALPGKTMAFKEDGVLISPLNKAPSGRYSTLWWSESRRYFEKNCLFDTYAVLSVSAAGFGILPIKNLMPNIPILMQAHGTSWGEIVSKFKSRRLRSVLGSIKNMLWIPKDLIAYQKFDGVVAVGEAVYADLTSPPTRWFLDKQKVKLINNGIDEKKFCPSLDIRHSLRQKYGIADTAPVFISASRLHVQKGVHNGIYAFAKFLNENLDARYFILGDGPEQTRLEELANELGVGESVKLVGRVSRSDLQEWLQFADVFIFLTERIEGLPLNILEAISVGLPAVVSSHLQVFDTLSITLVEPRDAEAVSSALSAAVEYRRGSPDIKLPEEFTLRSSAGNYLTLLKQLSDVPEHRSPIDEQDARKVRHEKA